MAALCRQKWAVLITITCLQFLMGFEAKELLTEKGNSGFESGKSTRVRRAVGLPNSKARTSESDTINVDEDESFEMNEVTDACASSPCMNAGVCTADEKEPGKKFRCACKLGHVGRTCNEVMLSCDTMQCTRRGDCVSSPRGAICVCDNGYKGRICEVKMESPTDWASLESVVTDPTQHKLSAVFAAGVVIMSVIALCLCIHCCRASAKSNKLRESYKADLQKGIVPDDPPPDLLDVSCKSTLCCCLGKSKDEANEKKPKKSKSKSTEDDLNKTANSITRAFRRSRRRSRDKLGHRRSNRRTDTGRSKSAHSYGSYDGGYGFNMNNSVGYEELDRPRTARRNHSTSRTRQGNYTYYDSVSSGAQRHHSSDRIVRRSPQKYMTIKTGRYVHNGNNNITRSKHPSPKFRFLKKKDKVKSTSKQNLLKYPFADDRTNYDHVDSHINDGKSRDNHGYYDEDARAGVSRDNYHGDYDSSESEEEIYHRARRQDHRTGDRSHYRNTNTNTNTTDDWATGDAHEPILASHEHPQFYMETENSLLSPDAKKNICANNSIALDSDIENADLVFPPDNDYKMNMEINNTDDFGAWYTAANKKRECITPCSLGIDAMNIELQERHTESLNEGTEVIEITKTVESNFSADEMNGCPGLPVTEGLETYGVLHMRVNLLDSPTETASLGSHVTAAKQLQDDIDNNANYNSNVCDAHIDLSTITEVDSEDRIPEDIVYDGTHVQIFEDDRTKQRVSEEVAARNQDGIDNDIEVIPDGKGSLVIVPKADVIEDVKDTIIEVGKFVNIDTTENELIQ